MKVNFFSCVCTAFATGRTTTKKLLPMGLSCQYISVYSLWVHSASRHLSTLQCAALGCPFMSDCQSVRTANVNSLTGGYLSSSGYQRLWQPLSLLAFFALIRYRCTRLLPTQSPVSAIAQACDMWCALINCIRTGPNSHINFYACGV